MMQYCEIINKFILDIHTNFRLSSLSHFLGYSGIFWHPVDTILLFESDLMVWYNECYNYFTSFLLKQTKVYDYSKVIQRGKLSSADTRGLGLKVFSVLFLHDVEKLELNKT